MIRVLLDTHIVLGLLKRNLAAQHQEIASRLADRETVAFVSVASFWETAIKTRLGKLEPGMPLEDIAGYVKSIRLSILPIDTTHVIAAVDPEPETRDPFDRLLLAQCQVEDMKLITLDRALVSHRLTLKT